MNQWLVRPARIEDAVGIARVSVAAWRAAYVGLMADSALARLSIEERARQWRDRLSDPSNAATSFVTEQTGAIAGFVSVGAARDEDLDPVRVGEVWAIYLLPLVWGKGAGQVLWARALEQLRSQGHAEVVLWVLGGNVRARRFYEKCGMTLDGGEKSPIEDGMPLPHLRYRRSLGG